MFIKPFLYYLNFFTQILHLWFGLCMILRFKVPLIYRNVARSAENSINWTLKVLMLWKNRPYLVHFCHSKTIPSLVQAFKPLPFVVLKVAEIRPYPSSHGCTTSEWEQPPPPPGNWVIRTIKWVRELIENIITSPIQIHGKHNICY